ncbi:MAG: D-alanine--D-alanine ligase [Planctomycetota bacterium]|nr:D-alanine--D-alanine ligase [Planctomycetota bacterium]
MPSPRPTLDTDRPLEGLKICLLTNQDLDARPFPAGTWPCDPRPYVPEATWTVGTLPARPESATRTAELVAEGYDLFFNLCDGAADEQTPGLEVIETLERHAVPFTGSDSVFYEPGREAMKRACRLLGIATPRYVLALTEEDVGRAADELEFPLFVKHPSSYASVDLTPRSRVTKPSALAREARKLIERRGGALIEEYIEGTECTVLVAENPADPLRPVTYQPMQYEFPPGESFKHAQLKWVDYGALRCIPVEDPTLDAALRDASARFFAGLGGVSFGRCDLRVDASGTPFMLEINANCGVFYPASDPGSADLCLRSDPAGHRGFTVQLIRAALARHARRKHAPDPRS